MNSSLKYIVVFLFVITLVGIGFSFSRFTTTVTNTGAENTLPPDIEFTVWALDSDAETVSLEGMTPGDSREIVIAVKNWKLEEGTPLISGYNQRVSLELETTGNLPLTFTLSENPAGDLVNMNRYGAVLYRSDNIEFVAQEPSTREYTLTVAWPGNMNAGKFKDEIDYIVLRLKAAQSQ